ncbi:threonine ammonia-lyase [Nonomuraea sediminis]|uniref:threonine ammonia-lyase n=1 Tax=Nonomuraea sediminis TaxID=2835864 RepID=UPI00202A50DE|nr:pyridoxal-phosphate dependent enzyme [Nonomuraea sediminis]
MEMDLDVSRIAQAAKTIDPVFLNTPQYVDEQLSARLGREVLVKVETANPLRSFKGRGADFLMAGITPGTRTVCVSSGNFGQAMAYTGRAHGVPVEVFVRSDINPAKRARMAAFGAEVIEVGDDPLSAAHEHVDRHADRVFIADGKEAAVAEGAGTIGLELLESGPFDTVVVQVGDGALINGVGLWVKEHAPGTRVVGVCAAGAPSLAESWRAGHVVRRGQNTVAEGINIDNPVPESVERMRHLVDDFVLVDDEAILAAARLARDTLGLLVEPAGAAGLAAITTHDLPGHRLAAILTGSNLRPGILD